MDNRTSLAPNLKYLTKLRITITIIAAAILLGGLVLGALLALDDDIGLQGFVITFLITAIGDLLWWAPGMLLTGPYFRSMVYEIGTDEIVMRVGIWTKAVKHVPYRTITNVTIKRDVLDRMLGMGSLDVQTAGISGTNTAEQSLAGLEDPQSIYEAVAAQLRRFRGSLDPTAAGQDLAPPAASDTSTDTLHQILAEIKAIRQAIETRSE